MTASQICSQEGFSLKKQPRNPYLTGIMASKNEQYDIVWNLQTQGRDACLPMPELRSECFRRWRCHLCSVCLRFSAIQSPVLHHQAPALELVATSVGRHCLGYDDVS